MSTVRSFHYAFTSILIIAVISVLKTTKICFCIWGEAQNFTARPGHPNCDVKLDTKRTRQV